MKSESGDSEEEPPVVTVCFCFFEKRWSWRGRTQQQGRRKNWASRTMLHHRYCHLHHRMMAQVIVLPVSCRRLPWRVRAGRHTRAQCAALHSTALTFSSSPHVLSPASLHPTPCSGLRQPKVERARAALAPAYNRRAARGERARGQEASRCQTADPRGSWYPFRRISLLLLHVCVTCKIDARLSRVGLWQVECCARGTRCTRGSTWRCKTTLWSALSYGFNTECMATHRLLRCAATPSGRAATRTAWQLRLLGRVATRTREGCHAVRVATLVYRAELVCNDRCNQCVLLYSVPNP